ncbi:MAG: hypothetical protein H7Y43_11085 [Akkermansiaceae bacterium]|nr:hypothetical protein [Verrucomicrobiales bacterium]
MNSPLKYSGSSRSSLLASALITLAFSVSGAEPAAPASAPNTSPAAVSAVVTKPAWLSDLSFTFKEGYDDNVFLSDADGLLQERDSWFTTITPKVGFNLLPLLPEQQTLKTFSFSYAPEFITYHNEPTESHNDHRIAVALKGKADAFSFSLDNAFVYIDGEKTAPTYTNGLNAYATATARERREQFQDRANVSVQFDQEKWFARAVSSLLYYELLSDQSTAPGYQNYVDRYDVSGGVDFGYKINGQVSATLGYRYGHQYQELVVGNALSASSDYQRVLVGVEGKPWKWLTVAIVGGPDFRSYADTAPVNDRTPVKYYGEASITAQPTAKDTLAFKYKQFQWVASTGKVPYFDSSYTLTYNRKLTSKLLLDLSGRILSSDYTSALTAIGAKSNNRDDWMYTAATGLAYTFTPNLSASVTYSIDFGRNNQDALTTVAREQREFQRQLLGVAGTLKF